MLPWKFRGQRNEITGKATAIDDTYARLLVDFGFGFEAPYTVIDLIDPMDGTPYSYATVTSFGTQFWVLSRTPDMPEERYQELLSRIDDRGGDSSRLIRTEQP